MSAPIGNTALAATAAALAAAAAGPSIGCRQLRHRHRCCCTGGPALPTAPPHSRMLWLPGQWAARGSRHAAANAAASCGPHSRLPSGGSSNGAVGQQWRWQRPDLLSAARRCSRRPSDRNGWFAASGESKTLRSRAVHSGGQRSGSLGMGSSGVSKKEPAVEPSERRPPVRSQTLHCCRPLKAPLVLWG